MTAVEPVARLADLRRRTREEAARGDMAVDLEVYQAEERDPLEPLLGGGSEAAAVGFFGRDPGRHEVRFMEPLIGAGGKLVRAGVHRAVHGGEPPDFDAERACAQHVFFSNTVPYKPVRNKAWSMAVKRRFQPFIAEYLVDLWQGSDLITLGNVAFEWFGIGGDRALRAALKAHMAQSDRYESSLEVLLRSPATGTDKTLRLHPLPHPSPLNATWYRHFPALLDARLARLPLSG